MSQTPIPTGFPSDDPQVLARVAVTEAKSSAALAVDALAKLRALHAEAMVETSVEYQALRVLETAVPILTTLLGKL